MKVKELISTYNCLIDNHTVYVKVETSSGDYVFTMADAEDFEKENPHIFEKEVGVWHYSDDATPYDYYSPESNSSTLYIAIFKPL